MPLVNPIQQREASMGYHSSGYFARKNDIFSNTFRGLINAALKSRTATTVLAVVILFLAVALIWNASVDAYVLSQGKRVAASVVGERRSSRGGYTTYYRYASAGQGNPLRLFDSFFRDGSRGRNVGVASTFGAPSGRVTVAFLPGNPRIHVVVEDRTWFVMLLIGTICLLAGGALIWNLRRLGRDEAALSLPGWPETA